MEHVYGILGILIFLSPLLLVFVVIAKSIGWKLTIEILVTVVGILSFLALGAYLLNLSGWLK